MERMEVGLQASLAETPAQPPKALLTNPQLAPIGAGAELLRVKISAAVEPEASVGTKPVDCSLVCPT